MHCYSHYNTRKEECQNCELRDYCKESTEDLPSLLSNRARKIPIEEIPKPLPIPKNYQHKEKKYSRRDMLELITFIVAMDEKNVRNILRIFGNDKENKVKKLMNYTNLINLYP